MHASELCICVTYVHVSVLTLVVYALYDTLVSMMPVGVCACVQEEARTMYADPDEFAQEMVKMINEKEFRSAPTVSAVASCGTY